MYGHPSIQAAGVTIRDLAKRYGMSGYDMLLRWAAHHSCLDGQHGDGLIFGVSKLEHVDKALDALEAGALPDDLAEALTKIYASVEGHEPPFHL